MTQTSATTADVRSLLEVEVRRRGLPEARRLKQLEEESARLKRRVADQALDNSVLKDLLKKYA